MPIEIRELVIRATIEEASGSPPTATRPPATEASPTATVETAVRQVLEILRRRTER